MSILICSAQTSGIRLPWSLLGLACAASVMTPLACSSDASDVTVTPKQCELNRLPEIIGVSTLPANLDTVRIDETFQLVIEARDVDALDTLTYGLVGEGITYTATSTPNIFDAVPSTIGGPYPHTATVADSCDETTLSFNSPAVADRLAGNWRWVEQANTSMNTVYREDIDGNSIYTEEGCWACWEMIQKAESGAVCADDKLYITGGGHLDGAHNGILVYDPVAKIWAVELDPSPILLTRGELVIGYHDGRREPAGQYGIDCVDGACNLGPDGRPVAQHTYDLLAWDGGDFLYMIGGSQWPNGKVGKSPKAWRYNLSTKIWAPIAEATESGREVPNPNGYAFFVGGLLYVVNGNGHFIYDPATDIWTSPSRLAGFSARTTVEYEPITKTFVAVGGGYAKYTSLAEFGLSWTDMQDAPAYLVDDFHTGALTAGGEIFYWNTGSRVDVFNPATMQWSVVTPGGDLPGDKLHNGTLGRFSNCGGKFLLINGVDKNVFELSL